MLYPFVFLLPVAAYGAALVFAFRRWRWFGIAALAAGVLLTEAILGTWAVLRPHEDGYPYARHWECHSLTMLPVVMILSAAGALALRIAGRRAGWGVQLGAVAMAFAVALLPAIYVGLYWVVQDLGCDTL